MTDSLPRKIALLLVSSMFITAGLAHFVAPKFFKAIVPPALPAPLTLVYISGAFEILGGVGILMPQTRRWAAVGLVLLLAAVFPANIYMAQNPDQFPDVPAWTLLARLPFQFLFAWLVWFAAGQQPS